MRFLLDANALIAVIWEDHTHHQKTSAWLEGKLLATCPLVELGFLRVSTNPRALGAEMDHARALLEDFYKTWDAIRISDDLPALESKADKFDGLNDQYLASLAAKHEMKLATLDQGIDHPAVELIPESPTA